MLGAVTPAAERLMTQLPDIEDLQLPPASQYTDLKLRSVAHEPAQTHPFLVTTSTPVN
jgi:hypothetical protein